MGVKQMRDRVIHEFPNNQYTNTPIHGAQLRTLTWTIRFISFTFFGAFAGLLIYLVVQGIHAFDPAMFTTGGVLTAPLVGTVWLVLLSVLVALPIGIGAGVYLAVYARGRVREVLSFWFELHASIPSIVIGLFGFALILALHTLLPTALPALWLASVSIAMLIVPYIIKATEIGIAETSPESIRLAYALGATREQVLGTIQFPSARRHILKGIILATARAAEDTAVIMLTGAVASYGISHSLTEPFEALPFYIYTTVAAYGSAEELGGVFVAALVLVGMAGVLVGMAGRLERESG